MLFIGSGVGLEYTLRQTNAVAEAQATHVKEIINDYFDGDVILRITDGAQDTNYDKKVELSEGRVAYINLRCDDEVANCQVQVIKIVTEH